jgi:hypothetical protein
MMASGPADEPCRFGSVSTSAPSSGGTFPAGWVGLPRPLDVEVPRLRLVQRLAQRWDRSVTLVVAGPGFGKTTVLAQAVRAQLAAPRGIDAWLSCEAAHEDPVRFAHALLGAVSTGHGVERSRLPVRRAAPGAREVIEAVIGWAPLEVCLLLDDVHEIPAGSPGAALLREIVGALPATGHLVLSGREEPELPLARREAAGEVVRIGCAELAFTDVEVAALARRLGRDVSLAAALQGWPALIRLAFAAGPSAPWRYAREEILGRLPGPQCRALAALAALGSATAAEVAAVTGGPVALVDLVRRIPSPRGPVRSSSSDLQGEQAGAERLSVGVEGQRRGDAAVDDLVADEVQGAQAGQLVPHDFTRDEGGQVRADPFRRQLADQQRVVGVVAREDRQGRGVPLVARAAMGQFMKQHGTPPGK